MRKIIAATDMAVVDSEITVLDYESTGSVSGYTNEPWQIGIVSIRKGKVDAASAFESLLRVNLKRPFNLYAPGRHALYRDAIAAAPKQQDIWLKIKRRLADCPLCAHNVATEKKFVRAMAPMHRFDIWIDTLQIARKAWPECPSYALEYLISFLGLKPTLDSICPGREFHDALYDAVAAAMLIEYLLLQPGWNRITIGELASI